MAAFPATTINTTFDGRVGGPNDCATLLVMPFLFGSGADQIPAGAKIVSAKLTLSIYSAQATSMRVSRILDPDGLGMWNGGDAVTADNVAVSYGYRDAQSGRKWSNSATRITQVLADRERPPQIPEAICVMRVDQEPLHESSSASRASIKFTIN